MGLFKRKTITINELIQIGLNLTNNLNADGVNGKNRSKIFEESGISKYGGTMYSGYNNQVQPSSLKYQVNEMSPPILSIIDNDGASTIYGQGAKCKTLFFINKNIGLTRVCVKVYACPIFKKHKDFLNSLKAGDTIMLKNCPVDVSYTHGYEPMTTAQRFNYSSNLNFSNILKEEPYCGDLNINIFL